MDKLSQYITMNLANVRIPYRKSCENFHDKTTFCKNETPRYVVFFTALINNTVWTSTVDSYEKTLYDINMQRMQSYNYERY